MIMLTPEDFPPKTQVVYVPTHAKGGIDHPDAEQGFVTSAKFTSDGRLTVFCRYYYPNSQRLRTTSVSEGCDATMLAKIDHRSPRIIDSDWLSLGLPDPV